MTDVEINFCICILLFLERILVVCAIFEFDESRLNSLQILLPTVCGLKSSALVLSAKRVVSLHLVVGWLVILVTVVHRDYQTDFSKAWWGTGTWGMGEGRTYYIFVWIQNRRLDRGVFNLMGLLGLSGSLPVLRAIISAEHDSALCFIIIFFSFLVPG